MKRLNTLSRPKSPALQAFVKETFLEMAEANFVSQTDVCYEVRAVYNNLGNAPLLRAKALAVLLAATEKFPSLLTLKDEQGKVVTAGATGFRELCVMFSSVPKTDIEAICRKVGLLRGVPNMLAHSKPMNVLGI
ncbi:hypothetical protein [Ralstonia insidiosa]|jgi:hypothetical protein|nr:hypothetical protein [Ralstonia insidiosa]MBA9940877.1 hypothetical protein [Ralstonia insidiosa]MBC9969070.1 hypothetical protein [Ralstonia insidiosa]MBX3905297.1 hypothetical protein [Ralstonia insidiosa]